MKNAIEKTSKKEIDQEIHLETVSFFFKKISPLKIIIFY